MLLVRPVEQTRAANELFVRQTVGREVVPVIGAKDPAALTSGWRAWSQK